MNDLLKDALTEYFNDYKQYHLIILIVFTLLIGGFQILQTIVVTKKIARFNAILKKSEIRFSRYNNLQIDSLKAIYTKLVDFNIANSSLFNSDNENNGHLKYVDLIDKWLISYYNFVRIVRYEKILIPNHLKTLIDRTITDFKAVKNIIIEDKTINEELLEEYGGKWQELYGTREDELRIINSTIKSMKAKPETIASFENIEAIRKALEDHFEEMNK